MEIKDARFLVSSAKFSQLPPPNLPEYAFVGRSNVGKSSWINALCQRRDLAKTSSTPGKTQLINHFIIDEAWYLVDLPGYGYARTSKKKRATFATMITDYVTRRESLMNLYVLLDGSIPPQAIDLEFMEFLGVEGVPFTILLTKTDKANQKEANSFRRALETEMHKVWEELPPIIATSATKGRGRDKVLNQIAAINADWTPDGVI
ncbi:MAG: YihA family ribosome biogenesis GTP-binding protein [Bacteroidetes bacterium]|nr:MAG: YihA family ribosome biogenesis GTP-binding protein [Bacteroidota bacterium]